MKLKTLLPTVIAATFSFASVAPSHVSADGDVGLIDLMGNFQYFIHKAGLSIRAGNAELADFYMHEIEENIEAVSEIDEYDGFPVGDLTPAMLTPSAEAVGSNLDSGNLDGALKAYSQLINACNACHLATDHGYIKIVDHSTQNPYMQDFN